MKRFITVATFYNQMQYLLFKSMLEAEGIFVFGRDEITNQTASYLVHGDGGIKLEVYVEDYQRAFDILRDAGYLKDEDLLPDVNLSELLNKASADKKHTWNIWRSALFIILLALLIILTVCMQYT